MKDFRLIQDPNAIIPDSFPGRQKTHGFDGKPLNDDLIMQIEPVSGGLVVAHGGDTVPPSDALARLDKLLATWAISGHQTVTC